jgi:hypothetical protein
MVQRVTSVIILLLKRRLYGQCDSYDYWYTNTLSYGGPSNFKQQLSSILNFAEYDTDATVMGNASSIRSIYSLQWVKKRHDQVGLGKVTVYSG